MHLGEVLGLIQNSVLGAELSNAILEIFTFFGGLAFALAFLAFHGHAGSDPDLPVCLQVHRGVLERTAALCHGGERNVLAPLQRRLHKPEPAAALRHMAASMTALSSMSLSTMNGSTPPLFATAASATSLPPSEWKHAAALRHGDGTTPLSLLISSDTCQDPMYPFRGRKQQP